jgi:hypothetical protein
LDKNWEIFKAHFSTEHQLYRKQTQTAQAAGYQASNHAQRGMQNDLLIEQSESLDMMATASATYRYTIISNLVTSNAKFSTHLVERSAALATANETIRSLQSVSRPNGGSASSSAARAPSNATARVIPATNNENYCWSHRYHIHADHISMTCTRQAEGHQELATKANNMGGSQWGRDAA